MYDVHLLKALKHTQWQQNPGHILIFEDQANPTFISPIAFHA
jgi:hypothetical protein